MTVRWDSEVVKLHLSPVGKPLGRGEKMSTVFKEYGDYRSRIVQAVAGMLDGDVVYMDAVREERDNLKPPTKRRTVMQTVPITGWRGGPMSSNCESVVAFMNVAFANDYAIECYGASRERWRLSVETSKLTVDAVDNMSDNSRPGVTGGFQSVEPNGIRLTF